MRSVLALGLLALCLPGLAGSAHAQAPDSIHAFAAEPARLLPNPEEAYRQMARALHYPAAALRQRVQGQVVVRAVVDTTGRPVATEVLRGVGAGCDEAVEAAVREVRFAPARHHGRRVSSYVTLPLRCPVAPLSEDDYERLDAEYHAVYRQEEVCPSGRLSLPELIGGLARLQSFIAYPAQARDHGIQGRVVVQFIVGEDGVPRSFFTRERLGHGLDEAAATAVSVSRFRPATCEGQPVPVLMTIPITFRL